MRGYATDNEVAVSFIDNEGEIFFSGKAGKGRYKRGRVYRASGIVGCNEDDGLCSGSDELPAVVHGWYKSGICTSLESDCLHAKEV